MPAWRRTWRLSWWLTRRLTWWLTWRRAGAFPASPCWGLLGAPAAGSISWRSAPPAGCPTTSSVCASLLCWQLSMPLSLVFDLPFLRACYGPKTALTLDEYKQYVGKGSMEVTHVVCLVRGCHVEPDAVALSAQFTANKGRISLKNVTVPAVGQWTWSGLLEKHTLHDFLKVYSGVGNGVLMIGEFKKGAIRTGCHPDRVPSG
ncbi:hypothetical protein CLOM_g17477 [Closterium sp. NIES-68]|nr:hypothetical protein CLOM_g17477 [Closterium sp. NIES-68]GJP59490.1 hypothetical protein CLOP_g12278 [Closterium sp. NIES-67]